MKYKVVFAGTPDFACPALESLLKDDRFDVLAVVSQPDRPVGRKQVITPTPVKALAQEYGVDVLQPEKIQDIESELKDLSPDFFVVMAYGQIFPVSVLEIARWNINLHLSLLPKYRGASPVQSSLLCGDKETGLTVMNIEEKMDAGGMYKKHVLQIEEEDNTATLFQKIGELGRKIPNDLEDVAKGLVAEVQDESQATFCKKIQKADGEIFWTEERSSDIFNRMRAFTPWPGVFFMYEGKRVKVLSGEVSDSRGFETQQGYFLPHEVLPEGKKRMHFRDWERNFLNK